MRLLQFNDDGEVILTSDLLDHEVPRYAILSHTWGKHGDEVSFTDLADRSTRSRAGYEKIRFCGQQASRDGLDYFWVDTCCIDKSNSTELQTAINSMFAWYRDAATCYVYLADVSKSSPEASDNTKQPSWETAFRKSRWFTRGWTLQELIAPASVEFFSKEGICLGNKASLVDLIREITGIPAEALRGDALSGFSISERMAWAENRITTRQEDKAYSLLGIFDVSMPLIYGENGTRAFKRLRATIDDALKGTKREDFAVGFSLDVAETECFVGRDAELRRIHELLQSDGTRCTAVLHGLGGIGKTQLAVAYAKRYRDNYSGVFWLNTRDNDSLKQSFAKIAQRILREHRFADGLSSRNSAENLDEAVAGVKEWLSLPNNTRWLMIYDNYDTPLLSGNADPAAVDIRKYLPESHQGCILITTRSSSIKLGRYINIKKLLDIREGLNILINSSRREELRKDPKVSELVQKLDGLPLALTTAGAYLHQTAMSCSDYLRLYESSWIKLLKSTPELDSYEDRMLYSTWQITFDNIKKQNKLSAHLLQFWAYFSNEDVWFELLQHAADDDPQWLHEMADELCFTQAVRVLCEHGLVEPASREQDQVESGGFSMHSCVHSWTVHVLNQEWNWDLARYALNRIASHVPVRSETLWWVTQ